MPSRARVEAFIASVVGGDHVRRRHGDIASAGVSFTF
jgi:hypothetical protein